MSQKYPGGFITKNPVAPTTSAAKGIWTLDQAANYVKQGIWPATPGAPTIGTATAGTAGSGTATVAFTAPSNLGSGAITYTATSSPGGLTGTGASPITVSGLTIGTAYTFTVTAATPGGTGPASAASNSVTPTLPAIGAAFGGGFYAGQIGVSSVATYNLVIAPASSGQFIGAWKTSNTTTAGTGSVIDGPANTAAMIAAGAAAHPCGQFCDNAVIGGFSDWYMPAKNEMEVCYYNLKPTTATNDTGSGINANAVPARASNYSAGTPAQTSATAFQSGNAEAFTSSGNPGDYWNSTERDSTFAFLTRMNRGGQYYDGKSFAGFSVRAVRRVAV